MFFPPALFGGVSRSRAAAAPLPGLRGY